MDDVRFHTPKSVLNTLSDEFFEDTLSATKQLTGISFKDAAIKFLSSIKQTFPLWFITRFEALQSDQSVPLYFDVSPDGLQLSTAEKVRHVFKHRSTHSAVLDIASVSDSIQICQQLEVSVA
jgi:hypothetical protein